MRFEMTKTVGKTSFKFQDDVANEKEFFKTASFFMSMPDQCGHCQSTELSVNYRTPKDYEYYSIDCKACGHSLKYGQMREGGGLFPKGWEAPYSDSAPQTQTKVQAPVKKAVTNGRTRVNEDIGFE